MKAPNNEVIEFIETFEDITNEYLTMVNADVSAITIHPEWDARMELLKIALKT